MTFLKRISALLLTLAIVLPATAQFSIGPRLGINANSLKFSNELFDTSNRVGFNGGIEAEFMIPMLNFGFDLSVMYVHRTTNFAESNKGSIDYATDYIEIPLNLKYKFGLPIVGNMVAPYIFTGPSVAFCTSKNDIEGFLKEKKCDLAWNFGLGVQLFRHLQVGASYGLGLTKVIETVNYNSANNSVNIEGKNRYWTVTAAWLF